MSRLRIARERRELTLKQAAAALNIDPGNLSRIERGIQTPGLELAERIAAFYGVSEIVVLYPNREGEDSQPEETPAA